MTVDPSEGTIWEGMMSDRMGRYLMDLKRDPDLAKRAAEDPLTTASNYAARQPAFVRDPWIYRMVVLFLGLSVLAAAIGSIVLVSSGHDVPSAIVAFGATATGALAGMLARPN